MFAGVDVVPLPSSATGSWSVAGRRVTPDRAVGLPAMLRGIRILSETIGSFPLIIYRGDPDSPAKEAVTANCPQYELLSHKPNDLQTPFELKAYIVASILGYGNAYLLKIKSRRRGVMQLYPIDPSRVRPEVGSDGFSLTYKVRLSPTAAQVAVMTRSDLIHIPGVLVKNPWIGVSPILAAANAVGSALATEEYAARFYDNDATPTGVIEFPGSANTQQAKDTRETWEDRHRGAKNAHRVGTLFGGATYKTIGVSAQAAQVIESQRWNVDQVANVLNLPAWLLGGTDQNPRSTPEERNTVALQYGFAPWLIRIEQRLHDDDDLFPDKGLVPHFLPDGILRADAGLRAAANLVGRQGGWLSINDVRRSENMAPVPGGDDYQVTPVGGAPNLQPAGGDEPAPVPNDDVVPPAEPAT